MPNWDAARERAVALVSRYVQFDTTNPPGNERPAAEWLRDQLCELRITRDVTLLEPAPGRAILIGRIPGSEPLKPLVLNHHIDVVPADPTKWSHPPFGGEVADGYVWGRGTLDTKGLGIVHMLALFLLIQESVSLRRPVIFLAVSDEETGGSQGMDWLVRNHLDMLDPEWVWDEGGSGIKGLLGDRVLFGVAVAEKRLLHLRVTATGQAGHGSMPHGDNANVTLMRALMSVVNKPQPVRINEVTERMLHALAGSQPFPASLLLRNARNPMVAGLIGKALQGNPPINAMLRDTISLTMLKAGYKVNVIPERAEAGLDCRLLPDTDLEAFLAWLRDKMGDGRVQIEVLKRSSRTDISPLDGELIDAMKRAVTRHVPDALVVPMQMPAASDSRFFRARGIPAYGLGPFVIDKEEIKLTHGVDERISIENLELGIKIAYDVIREVCAK